MNVVVPGSETVIWASEHLAPQGHHAGGVVSAKDGRLRVAVGDPFVSARQLRRGRGGSPGTSRHRRVR